MIKTHIIMKIISFGGVGGCDIPQSIQRIMPTIRYPYDWILADQKFVMRTLINNNEFFNFTDKTKIIGKTVIVNELDGMSIHDFSDTFDENNYNIITDDINKKYHRRFTRLNEALKCEEPILFIRIANNTPQLKEWEKIFNSEPDNFPKWVEFIQYLNDFYKKPIYLLIITKNEEEYNIYKCLENKDISINYINDKIMENLNNYHHVLSNVINGFYTKININNC